MYPLSLIDSCHLSYIAQTFAGFLNPRLTHSLALRACIAGTSWGKFADLPSWGWVSNHFKIQATLASNARIDLPQKTPRYTVDSA
jgi:hypothetical protein